MKTIVLFTLVLSGLIGLAAADILVTNIVFEVSGNDTYTVPTGKVLVVEHAVIMSADSGLRYTPPGSALTISLLGSSSGFTSFHPTFKAPGGGVFTAEDLQSHHAANGAMFGLLVDPEDLYAAIPGEIEWLTAGLTGVQGLVRLASPQPARVQLDTCEDLLQALWRDDPSVAVSSHTDKRAAPFAATRSPEPAQFYRVNARARR